MASSFLPAILVLFALLVRVQAQHGGMGGGSGAEIHGGWGEWSHWSFCTKTVSGIQTRKRECVNPKPKYGGKPCSGSRAVVRECKNTSSCNEEFLLRFRTKGVPSVGTMEIFKNNTWKKLCIESWDDVDGNLTCTTMGYYNNGLVENGTWNKGVNDSNTRTHHNCASLTRNCVNSSRDNRQFCKVPVRLNGLDVEYGGRVEVFYNGKWGRICRNEWDLHDVEVVCRQLGFQSALAEFIGSDVNADDIPFLMSKVSCTGGESDLTSCKRADGENDCQDDKGAQALCEPKNRDVLEKKAINTEIGSSETITCSLKNATGYIKWYDSIGRQLMTTNKFGRKVEVSGGKLTLHNIALSDGGTYRCQGLSYIRVYTIYVNADFIKTPEKQTLVSGKPGTVSCNAQGAPDPQLEKWSREDGTVLETTRFTQLSNWGLYVNPVRPEDEGRYRCHIKQNKRETTTSKYKVIDVAVNVPPEIQLSRLDGIQEGDDITLNCTIKKGSPTPSVQWYKDGKRLPEESTKLFLREVNTEDGGNYMCKAENVVGYVEDDINITVYVLPKVDRNLENKSVALSTTFTMKCVEAGFPSPEVNWTKNGILLPNAGNIITINHTSFDDEGQYECSAGNRVGKINKTVWIKVTVSPQVSVSPVTQTVSEGQATNISCKATGVPRPKITWKFKDGDLPSGINVSTTDEGSILQMRNTTKGMEGSFKCTATNKADSADSTATVRVLGIPTAEVGPNPHPTLMEGDTLRLTCKVSETASEIKWKKNDDLVKSNAGSKEGDKMDTLVIKNVDTDDSGYYSCEAHNQAGFSSSSVEIRVRAFTAGKIFEWYYIVGPLSAVIIITFVSWYICKRRMTDITSD